MRVIDVKHLGRPNVIGCWEVDGALIDPGPESSLETLLAALDGEQPAAIVLTHIHLDHAAATGAIVRRWPETPVYVHERGAPHLIDPSRLLASAERLYGDAMERLWGEIVPVPEQNVRALAGGETVLGLRVAYTPGHASHHVCYLHEETGTAFVGDVAAVLIPATNLVVPPTPPPDIDIETWLESIETVEAWKPERLAITHFGAIDSPAEHLATVRRSPRRGGPARPRPRRGQVREAPPGPGRAARRHRGGRRGADPVPSPRSTSGAGSTVTGASGPSGPRPERLALAPGREGAPVPELAVAQRAWQPQRERALFALLAGVIPGRQGLQPDRQDQLSAGPPESGLSRVVVAPSPVAGAGRVEIDLYPPGLAIELLALRQPPVDRRLAVANRSRVAFVDVADDAPLPGGQFRPR